MKKPAIALMIGASKKGDGESTEGRFKAPEGFDMDGKKPGDTIEAVVELEVEEDGMLCVKKLNGMDVPGYGEGEKKEGPEEEKEPYKGGFADAVMGAPAEGEEEGM